MSNRPLITIIEGPAGCGKTTVMAALADMGFFLIHRNAALTENTRDFGDLHDDALMSQMKDLYCLSSALVQVADHPCSVPLIDRFFLSQLVYGSIRRRIPVYGNIDYVVDHLLAFSDQLMTDYLFRTKSGNFIFQPSHIPPQFLFILLVPTLDQLVIQRASTVKTYPFSPIKEVSLYQRFFSRDSNSLLKIEWGTETDRETLIRRIKSETASKLEQIGGNYDVSLF